MAFFKKKTAEDEAPPEGDGEFTPQPDKAQKWFEHAKTAAMSSNFGYAIECYANGIRLDPGRMSAHESMWDAAIRFANAGAKPASSREVRSIDDGTPVGKFAAAEFEWMRDVKNYKAAVKALEASVKSEQFEFGHWAAGRVFNLLRGQKKLTKSLLLQAMQLFRDVNAWDESMAVGEMARQLDPSDNDLDSELKNLAAQRAMEQGGYNEAAGTEGGFRKFIKDADKQQELLEEETLAAGASTDERNLSRARRAYEESPTAPDVINRFAQLLKKQGTLESMDQARAIYEKGFADTGEYRFRMSSGDIQIEQLVRKLSKLDEQLAASAGENSEANSEANSGANSQDSALRAERDKVKADLLALKSVEYGERVEKYPTDRMRKYDLGDVQFQLGRYDEAMAQFQAAKDEPRLRVRAGYMLGRCFLAEQWYSEAISEFEDALRAVDATEKDREQMIRYDLMVAMIEGARADDSIDLARQAKTICSDIARKDITYRDIRAKRREVDQLIKAITGD